MSFHVNNFIIKSIGMYLEHSMFCLNSASCVEHCQFQFPSYLNNRQIFDTLELLCEHVHSSFFSCAKFNIAFGQLKTSVLFLIISLFLVNFVLTNTSKISLSCDKTNGTSSFNNHSNSRFYKKSNTCMHIPIKHENFKVNNSIVRP